MVLSKSCANEHFHPLTFATRSCRADLCASKCEAAIWIKTMFKKHWVFSILYPIHGEFCALRRSSAGEDTHLYTCFLMFCLAWCFSTRSCRPIPGRFLDNALLLHACVSRISCSLYFMWSLKQVNFYCYLLHLLSKWVTFLFTLTTIYKVSVQKVIFFSAKHNLKPSILALASGSLSQSAAQTLLLPRMSPGWRE